MGALEGLKILDFTTLLPGPYATLMLADLGAEVVKISSPGRHDLVVHWPPEIDEHGTTGAWAWLGRNKKSMFLDMKKPGSVDIVKRMIMDYDIVVEQFRPGVMKRLGIDYDTLKQVNPRIIYCSITGYGQTGPMSMKAGHDINYLARSGIVSAAGRREEGPSLHNFQIADMASGSNNAVIGILAAVYHREKTGEGQYIDISMADGTVPFNSMDGASFLAGGELPKREEMLLNGGDIYDYYRTKDGKYMSVGSLEPKFFSALLKTLDLSEHADLDRRELKEKISRKFMERTRDEWTEIFSGTDACVEPVLTLEEASRDEHLRERGMWPNVKLPLSGKSVIQPGCAVKLEKCPPDYRHAAYPEGYNTEEFMDRYSKDE